MYVPIGKQGTPTIRSNSYWKMENGIWNLAQVHFHFDRILFDVVLSER